jgi:predicted outer membrane repeat protein
VANLGGAIYIDSGAVTSFVLSGSQFTGNSATTSGGAVYLNSGSNVYSYIMV